MTSKRGAPVKRAANLDIEDPSASAWVGRKQEKLQLKQMEEQRRRRGASDGGSGGRSAASDGGSGGRSAAIAAAATTDDDEDDSDYDGGRDGNRERDTDDEIEVSNAGPLRSGRTSSSPVSYRRVASLPPPPPRWSSRRKYAVYLLAAIAFSGAVYALWRWSRPESERRSPMLAASAPSAVAAPTPVAALVLKTRRPPQAPHAPSSGYADALHALAAPGRVGAASAAPFTATAAAADDRKRSGPSARGGAPPHGRASFAADRRGDDGEWGWDAEKEAVSEFSSEPPGRVPEPASTPRSEPNGSSDGERDGAALRREYPTPPAAAPSGTSARRNAEVDGSGGASVSAAFAPNPHGDGAAETQLVVAARPPRVDAGADRRRQHLEAAVAAAAAARVGGRQRLSQQHEDRLQPQNHHQHYQPVPVTSQHRVPIPRSRPPPNVPRTNSLPSGSSPSPSPPRPPLQSSLPSSPPPPPPPLTARQAFANFFKI